MPLIVGVAILRDGCVLAAQRSYPAELAGLWEFPGGKVRPGEDEQAAAVRECREELGVEVRVGTRVGPVATTAAGDTLHLWTAELLAGEPRPLEHVALRWLAAGELDAVAWLPPDLPLVAAVAPLLAAGV